MHKSDNEYNNTYSNKEGKYNKYKNKNKNFWKNQENNNNNEENIIISKPIFTNSKLKNKNNLINIGEININDKKNNSLFKFEETEQKIKESNINNNKNIIIKEETDTLPWRNGGNKKDFYYNKKDNYYYNNKNYNNYYNYNNRNKFPLNQPKSKKSNKFD